MSSALEGWAEPALFQFPHTRLSWSKLGAGLKALSAAGAREVLIIGRFARPRLRDARPDWGFIAALPSVLRVLRQGGDDALLRCVVALFEPHGFRVVGVKDVAPELLIPSGLIAGPKLGANDVADIETGMAVIAALAPFDIGQAAIVSEGRIAAIEAAEGTDAMIARVARVRADAGFDFNARRGVLIKRAKPGQDLRVDLPTIGPDTIDGVVAAGLAGVAAESEHVIATNRETLVKRAEAVGAFVIGVNAAAGVNGASRSSSALPDKPRTHQKDAALGVSAIRALGQFATGSAAVVRSGRILAIGADEPVLDVIARAEVFGDRRKRARGGVAVVGDEAHVATSTLIERAADSGLAALALMGDAQDAMISPADRDLARRRGLAIVEVQSGGASGESKRDASALNVFLVAGEHSGDALGARLMAAMREKLGGAVRFTGVGGEEMASQGLVSLFPIEDIAVMGPVAIFKGLPRIYARVHQTVDAAVAARPDLIVIIDSPEFTHPIAKRIRKRAPEIPIVDYVSPSVWAWRPGRARKMRAYVDHVLALLPFEPAAHAGLGGPPCTYVGHPLIEKLGDIRGADAAELASRLGLSGDKPVLIVLPGSRRTEVSRLIDVFGETVRRLAEAGVSTDVVIPSVRHVRPLIEARTASWDAKPHIVDSADKYKAMRLARAALAASGTVTLELALAGTPMVVAYRTDPVIAQFRFLVTSPTVVLANLVLGENAFPEFLSEECTADNLAAALAPLFDDGPARRKQLEALQRIPALVDIGGVSPSAAAAEAALAVVYNQPSIGKSRLGAPT